MIVAITGRPASGKSAVCKMISDLGYCVVDSDIIAHEEMEKVRQELENLFGIPNDGNPVDRKFLADIVFGDDRKLNTLESLIHPLVILRLKKMSVEKDIVAEVSAIRPEHVVFFDKVIVVESPIEERIKRAKDRGWSEEELKRRDRHFYEVPGGIFFYNDGDLEVLRKKSNVLVDALFEFFRVHTFF